MPIVKIFHGIIIGGLGHFIDYGSTILIYIQGLFWLSVAFLQTLSIFFAIDISWKYNKSNYLRADPKRRVYDWTGEIFVLRDG